MDIKTLEDAIMAGLSAEYPAVKVARSDTVKAEDVRLPAIFIETANVRESQFATEEETHYAVAMSALVVYRNSEKADCMQALAGLIDFINRNDWGLSEACGAAFTGAAPVAMSPEQKDLYIWQINFVHYLKP